MTRKHLTCKLYSIWNPHDDVIKWKHFPRNCPFVRVIHRSPVNSSPKGQWSRALMFSLICARINGWVNNREAGDLRRYRAHYDVIVMCDLLCCANASWQNWHLRLFSADDIFKCISWKKMYEYVPEGSTDNISSGDKPLSEPMRVSLQTHISATRPQWVKESIHLYLVKCVIVYIMSALWL